MRKIYCACTACARERRQTGLVWSPRPVRASSRVMCLSDGHLTGDGGISLLPPHALAAGSGNGSREVIHSGQARDAEAREAVQRKSCVQQALLSRKSTPTSLLAPEGDDAGRWETPYRHSAPTSVAKRRTTGASSAGATTTAGSSGTATHRVAAPEPTVVTDLAMDLHL